MQRKGRNSLGGSDGAPATNLGIVTIIMDERFFEVLLLNLGTIDLIWIGILRLGLL
jgi:hypothetical protein